MIQQTKRATKLSGAPRLEIARSEGLEPPTYKFVACCSIQLSYDRTIVFDSREFVAVSFGERGIRTLDTL